MIYCKFLVMVITFTLHHQ